RRQFARPGECAREKRDITATCRAMVVSWSALDLVQRARSSASTREGKLNFEFAIILMRNWNRDSARNMRMVEQITILRPAREVPCGTIRAHGRAK
ncbi:MAG: hypothetical protein WB499_02735, partial [Pseudolabrys sp.]